MLWYLSPFGGASHLDEDVGIAVAVPVAAGDGVALLQITGA